MWCLWGSPASFGLGYEPQPLQILWTSVASYLGFPLPRFIPYFSLGEQIDISLKIKKISIRADPRCCRGFRCGAWLALPCWPS